jgi:hypothetical protein
MCAGLYPNIARIRLSPDKSSKRPCLFETKFEKHILIHPRSINAKLRVNYRSLFSVLSRFFLPEGQKAFLRGRGHPQLDKTLLLFTLYQRAKRTELFRFEFGSVRLNF